MFYTVFFLNFELYVIQLLVANKVIHNIYFFPVTAVRLFLTHSTVAGAKHSGRPHWIVAAGERVQRDTRGLVQMARSPLVRRVGGHQAAGDATKDDGGRGTSRV